MATLEPGFTPTLLIFPLAGIGLLGIGVRIVSGAIAGRRPSDPGVG